MAYTAFWFSLSVLAYVYFGYPLILFVWKTLAEKQVSKAAQEPSVTLIVAAYNEARVIDAKLANCLELDYPRHLLQVIVSLDGSTDGTESIARAYEAQGVMVLSGNKHRGKAAAINSAWAKAVGDVLVFADARQYVERDAIRQLVANFHDSSVGAVSGELIAGRDRENDAGSSEAVGIYWRYEKRLRNWESAVDSVVGSTGALHAIRTGLFQPLAEDTILDDVVIPMTAILKGKRAVFEAKARVHDKLPPNPTYEFGRKVRTLMGNFQLIALMPSLMHPWRNRIFLQFVSHKLARLIAAYFLFALYASSAWLSGSFYRFAFWTQTLCYLMAVIGYCICRAERSIRYPKQGLALSFPLWNQLSRIARFAYTFVLLNLAAIPALYNFVKRPRGGHTYIWSKYSGEGHNTVRLVE